MLRSHNSYVTPVLVLLMLARVYRKKIQHPRPVGRSGLQAGKKQEKNPTKIRPPKILATVKWTWTEWQKVKQLKKV